MALDDSGVVDLCSPSPARGRRDDGLGDFAESSVPDIAAPSARQGLEHAGPSGRRGPVPSVRDVVAEASRLFGSSSGLASSRPRAPAGGPGGRTNPPPEVIEILDDDDPPPPGRREDQPRRKRRRRERGRGGASADQLRGDEELARRLAAETIAETAGAAGGASSTAERARQEEEDLKLARQLQRQEEHSAALAAAAAQWHPPGPSGGGVDRFPGGMRDGPPDSEDDDNGDDFFRRLMRGGRDPYQNGPGWLLGHMMEARGLVPPRPGGRAAGGTGGRGSGGGARNWVGGGMGALHRVPPWATGESRGGSGRGGWNLATQLAMRQGDFSDADYEQLLRLDEQHGGRGGAKKAGASAADISALPTTVVPGKRRRKGPKEGAGDDAGGAGPAGAGEEAEPCVVCLDEHLPGQTLRVLPCGHRFHKKCIDSWLKKKASCPVCVRDIPRV